LRRADELIAFCTRQGSRHFLTFGKVIRGWATFASGKEREGIAQMSSALEQHLETGSIGTHTFHIAHLAEAYGQVRQHDKGLELVDEGLKVVRDHGDARWKADLYRVRGDLLAARAHPDLEAAREAYESSLQTARAQEGKSFQLRTTIRVS